jgi:hypothetical protein
MTLIDGLAAAQDFASWGEMGLDKRPDASDRISNGLAVPLARKGDAHQGRVFLCAVRALREGGGLMTPPPANPPYTKPWLSCADQVALLESRGLTIADETKAAERRAHPLRVKARRQSHVEPGARVWPSRASYRPLGRAKHALEHRCQRERFGHATAPFTGAAR